MFIFSEEQKCHSAFVPREQRVQPLSIRVHSLQFPPLPPYLSYRVKRGLSNGVEVKEDLGMSSRVFRGSSFDDLIISRWLSSGRQDCHRRRFRFSFRDRNGTPSVARFDSPPYFGAVSRILSRDGRRVSVLERSLKAHARRNLFYLTWSLISLSSVAMKVLNGHSFFIHAPCRSTCHFGEGSAVVGPLKPASL